MNSYCLYAQNFHPMAGLQAGGGTFRVRLVTHKVDGDGCTSPSEGLGDGEAKSSTMVAQVSLTGQRAWLGSWGTYLAPPVMRTRRPFSSYGMASVALFGSMDA